MSREMPDEISVTPRRDSRAARRLTSVFGWISGAAVMLAIIAALLYPLLTPHGDRFIPITCRSNTRQLGNALLMYLQDYDDRMPPAATWSDDLYPYIKNTSVFVCPQRPGAPGFAFNPKLDRRPLRTILVPAAAPTIFESFRGTVNAADPLQSFLTPHLGKGTVVFADGHAQQLTAAPSATAGLKGSKR